jgi:hypothetical protein
MGSHRELKVIDIVEVLDVEAWAYESVLLLLGKGVLRLQLL